MIDQPNYPFVGYLLFTESLEKSNRSFYIERK